MGKTKKISKKQADLLRSMRRICVEDALGGKYSISYKLLSELCELEFDTEFELEFLEDSIAKLDADEFDRAVEFATDWYPSNIVTGFSAIAEDAFREYIDRFFEEMPKDSPAYQQLMEDFLDAVCTSTEGLNEG